MRTIESIKFQIYKSISFILKMNMDFISTHKNTNTATRKTNGLTIFRPILTPYCKEKGDRILDWYKKCMMKMPQKRLPFKKH